MAGRYLVLLRDSHQKSFRPFEVEADNHEAALYQVATPNYSDVIDTLEWGGKAQVYELGGNGRRCEYELRTTWVQTN